MEINTFLMMGRPGSGKGTQGKLLADAIGAKLYSSGARFRELSTHTSFLGRKVKQDIDQGNLLPHWLASFLYEETLFSLEPEQKIVFEGACRKEPEAIRFHEVAEWLGRPYRAIYINVPEDKLLERLLKRRETEGRADDTEAVIKNRFVQYNLDTAQAVEYFRKEGTLVEVSGDHPIEDVHASVMQALKLS